MRPVLLSQTPHKFYSVARNNDGEKFVRYKCEVCRIEGKRYGISEVIHLKDNAPSECNPDKEDPMPRKKEESPVVEQTQGPEPVQQSAFEGDGLDPQIAKVADRVVDLLVQKKSTDDSLKIQKRNLIGMLTKLKKTQIQHRNMMIKVKIRAEKEELTIKQLKPIDGQKQKAKRVNTMVGDAHLPALALDFQENRQQ